jgi:hypothetical protein
MARNNNVSDADNLRYFRDRGGRGEEEEEEGLTYY